MTSIQTTRQDLLVYLGPRHATVLRVDPQSAQCLTRVPMTLDVRGDILSSLIRSIVDSGQYSRILLSLDPRAPSFVFKVTVPEHLPVVRLPPPHLMHRSMHLHRQHDPPGAEVGPPQPIPRYPEVARL